MSGPRITIIPSPKTPDAATGGSVGDGGLREAHRAGYYAWAAPASGKDVIRDEEAERQAWIEYSAALAQRAPVGEDETGVREALDGINVHEQAENYTFRSDTDHTPSDFEKELLEDFGLGLMEKLYAALAPQPPKAETPAGVAGGAPVSPLLASCMPPLPDGFVYVRTPDDKFTVQQKPVSTHYTMTAALSTAPAARPRDEVDEGVCGLAIRRYREARRDYGGTSAEASVARQNLWDLEELIRALAAAPAAKTECVRHVKRGTEYEVLGEAEAQVSTRWANWKSGNRPLVEGNTLTVYRDPKSGKLWCRFTDEFRDGRFVSI